MAGDDNPVKILVTGAAGFLGSSIVQALLVKHPRWRIYTLDIRPLPASIAERVEQHFIADIRYAEEPRKALQACRPDIVVHTAGMVPHRQLRYSTDAEQWRKVRTINYDGTVHVLDATLEVGCRLFVYTSSCTALIDDLDHDYRNMDETIPIGHAKLHYGKSKGMAEQYVLSAGHVRKGLKTCALRPSTIIGPGDTQVISLLYDCIKTGETNFVVGDGDNIYDWMYIDNAVHAHVLAIENLLGPQTAAGHAFFISNQEPVYFWDFLLCVWAQFGHYPSTRFFIPENVAWLAGCCVELFDWLRGTQSALSRGSVQDGVRTHYSNNCKAQDILGYYPEVGMSEGVRRSCEAFKSSQKDRAEANGSAMLN